MFYLGNLLIFLSSSLSVSVLDFMLTNANGISALFILAVLTCLTLAGLYIVVRSISTPHFHSALGRSLGIAMIVVALLSGMSEENYIYLPNLVLFLAYIVPGVLIYFYNREARPALHFGGVSKKFVGFLKRRLEERREMFAPKRVVKSPVEANKVTRVIRIDEVCKNLSFAANFSTIENDPEFTASLRNCEIHLLEIGRQKSLVESYQYLIEEINELTLSYIKLLTDYVQSDVTFELRSKVKDAFSMIEKALSNIYNDYMEAEAFRIGVKIRALEYRLGSDGLIDSGFKSIKG